MISARNTAILFGLYLSKFDEEGILELGFKGPQEAFNVLGYAIGIKPASIKNYRDEFDPYFSNRRKGWHNRLLRENCKIVLNEYNHLDFNSFSELVKTFLISNFEVEKFLDSIKSKDYSETVAKRLVTGRSAEEFFRKHYSFEPQFDGFKLIDTTLLACGFDFKLDRDNDYYCVEVKGLQGKSGTITLTEKEYTIAEQLQESYCLYIVSNFLEKPNSELIFNPIKSNLKFLRKEKLVNQITFSANI